MKRCLSLVLIFLLVISMSLPSFANSVVEQDVSIISTEVSSEEYFEESSPEYILVGQEETEYGTVYFVTNPNKKVTRVTLWDAADIIMSGVSWAQFVGDPSWGNFAWAVLDSVSILPVLPSTAYFRQGMKTFIRVNELQKFIKTSKGAKALKSALTGYRYADAISGSAIGPIMKYYKSSKECEKLLNAFKAAANIGLVAANGKQGIKKLSVVKKVGSISFTHEIKLLSQQYANLRIYGYQEKTGRWIFSYFGNALH